jgi:putative transposase
VGKKIVYRLYRKLGLQMRTKKRRKLASEQRRPVESAVRANQRWSMDFITNRLENGRYFRTLTRWINIPGSVRSWKRPTR